MELQSHLLHRQHGVWQPVPRTSVRSQPPARTQTFLVVATSLPFGSDVQFRLVSSATVCWVLPSDLAIVASLSPLLRPASISSLSSYVIVLLAAAIAAPVPRPKRAGRVRPRARWVPSGSNLSHPRPARSQTPTEFFCYELGIKIAERLCLSTNTILSYAKGIYRKLGVHKKQEVIDLLATIDGCPEE